MMPEKILFVDDEPAVLDGYKRLLHKEFTIETALGAEAGLATLQSNGPFPVVVSDMRMPKMDGVQFLSKVKSIAPETVRMILTGYADVPSAIAAVNDSNIFRFLTKPCEKENLGKALTAALMQYWLVVAEKDLLEKTLRGAVRVLADVLSFVNPAAFGRSVRIQRYVQHVILKRQTPGAWRFEIAAMLSQLGCVTLDTECIEAIIASKKLSAEQQARYDVHPQVARDLLANIPRLEQVAWMIAHQHGPVPEGPPNADVHPDIVFGAHLLKLAVAFDRLLTQGYAHKDALAKLQVGAKPIERTILELMNDLDPGQRPKQTIKCAIKDLSPGMILQEDVRMGNGLMLVAKGQELTYSAIVLFRNYWQRGAIAGSVLVQL